MQCTAIIPTDKNIAIFDRCGRAYRPLSLQQLLFFQSGSTVRTEGYGHLCTVFNTAAAVVGHRSLKCAAGDLAKVDDLARFRESASFDGSGAPDIFRIPFFSRILHLAMECAIFDGAKCTIHHGTVEGAAFDHTRVHKTDSFVVHLTVEGTAFNGRAVGHRSIENTAGDFCGAGISKQVDTAIKRSAGNHHTTAAFRGVYRAAESIFTASDDAAFAIGKLAGVRGIRRTVLKGEVDHR